MKRISILTMVFAALLFAGCKSQATQVQYKDRDTIGQQNKIYQDGQPIPIFNYSQTRATLVEIYKAKTSTTATWTVVYSLGKPVFTCPSIGFPIPSTAQLTSPETYGGYNGITLPQAEPDGTYTGSSAATYILCVRADGSTSPVYAEPDVMTFTYPVKIVDGAVVDAGGKSTVNVETKKP